MMHLFTHTVSLYFLLFPPTFHRQWDKTTRGSCTVKVPLFSQVGACVADGTSDAHLALLVHLLVLSNN